MSTTLSIQSYWFIYFKKLGSQWYVFFTVFKRIFTYLVEAKVTWGLFLQLLHSFLWSWRHIVGYSRTISGIIACTGSRYSRRSEASLGAMLLEMLRPDLCRELVCRADIGTCKWKEKSHSQTAGEQRYQVKSPRSKQTYWVSQGVRRQAGSNSRVQQNSQKLLRTQQLSSLVLCFK